MGHNVEIAIPHRLGRDEAKRRIESGLDKLLQPMAGAVTIDHKQWSEYRLEFSASAVGQTVPGSINVEDENVLISLQLPWFLASLATKAKTALEQGGKILLEDKRSA